MRHIAVLLLTGLMIVPLVGEERVPTQWSRFRGPNGSGVADDEKPPITFGPTSNLRWKVALAPGHSSPVIWDNHIFVTGVDGDKIVVIAIGRRDGKLLWQRHVPANAIEKVHPFSSAAASTPATDGERVYVYLGAFGVLAYDFSGREVWRKPLPLAPTQWGTASSPIVHDGKVILQRDGNNAGSELLALEARTGAVIWQTPRPFLRESWSTPIVWDENGQPEIITVGSSRLAAYAASDGAERWWARGLTHSPITLAVYGDGRLFASSAFTGSPDDPPDLPRWADLIERYDGNKDAQIATAEVPKDVLIHLRKSLPKDLIGNAMPLPIMMSYADGNKDGVVTSDEWRANLAFADANQDNVIAMRPGGKGDSTSSHMIWKASRGVAEISSPLYYRGRLFSVRHGGVVTSYAPASGEIMLDRQRLGALGPYFASPVAADGRIYVASEEGVVVVFRAADTLDVLARNDLGESIHATPAIADHTLYIRTASHLWAFGDQGERIEPVDDRVSRVREVSTILQRAFTTSAEAVRYCSNSDRDREP